MLIKNRAALAALALALLPSTAHAHATAGNRSFPATLTVEDPGVSDEITLPQVSYFNHETTTSVEASKRITEDFGLSVEGAWLKQGSVSGFENFGVGGKYVFLKDAPHEFMMAAGVGAELGNTGAERVGAEDFTVITPQLFFGKGLGDLSAPWVRPFAVTGQAGLAMPLDGSQDRALEWGLTLQYSLPYMQQHVKDIGLSRPFSTVVPVVELAAETPFGGRTTGTIAPGVIFMGESVQLGLEALIPLNGGSGGATAQLHFYLDDIFPAALGKPLW
jgi:hypothetical protein